MNGIGDWFRRMGMKMNNGLRNFMRGRYGTDKLNTAILVAGVVCCVLGWFTGSWSFLFVLMSYALMGWAIFRMLSRNTYKRYQENRKYLRLLEQMKDREHRYFECPRCRQPVRVPRKKGKIAITCPKCREKFIRKT